MTDDWTPPEYWETVDWGSYNRRMCIDAAERELSDSLTAGGIRGWWYARNRLLGKRTPIKAMNDGDYDQVVMAANALAEGHYT